MRVSPELHVYHLIDTPVGTRRPANPAETGSCKLMSVRAAWYGPCNPVCMRQNSLKRPFRRIGMRRLLQRLRGFPQQEPMRQGCPQECTPGISPFSASLSDRPMKLLARIVFAFVFVGE